MSRAVQVSPSPIAQIVRILSSSNRRELSQLSRNKSLPIINRFQWISFEGVFISTLQHTGFSDLFRSLQPIFSLSSDYVKLLSKSFPSCIQLHDSLHDALRLDLALVAHLGGCLVSGWSPGAPGTAGDGHRSGIKKMLKADPPREHHP